MTTAPGAPTSIAANAPRTVQGAALPLPRQLALRDAERLRRYREYLDYHEGRRGAPPRRARERTLTFNYARAIVEKGVSYLVTVHRPLVQANATGAEARRTAAAVERLLLDTWEANE